jgi:hypothetical protein
MAKWLIGLVVNWFNGLLVDWLIKLKGFTPSDQSTFTPFNFSQKTSEANLAGAINE